jgi:hypothetical protein
VWRTYVRHDDRRYDIAVVIVHFGQWIMVVVPLAGVVVAVVVVVFRQQLLGPSDGVVPRQVIGGRCIIAYVGIMLMMMMPVLEQGQLSEQPPVGGDGDTTLAMAPHIGQSVIAGVMVIPDQVRHNNGNTPTFSLVTMDQRVIVVVQKGRGDVPEGLQRCDSRRIIRSRSIGNGNIKVVKMLGKMVGDRHRAIANARHLGVL